MGHSARLGSSRPWWAPWAAAGTCIRWLARGSRRRGGALCGSGAFPMEARLGRAPPRPRTWASSPGDDEEWTSHRDAVKAPDTGEASPKANEIYHWSKRAYMDLGLPCVSPEMMPWTRDAGDSPASEGCWLPNCSHWSTRTLRAVGYIPNHPLPYSGAGAVLWPGRSCRSWARWRIARQRKSLVGRPRCASSIANSSIVWTSHGNRHWGERGVFYGISVSIKDNGSARPWMERGKHEVRTTPWREVSDNSDVPHVSDRGIALRQFDIWRENLQNSPCRTSSRECVCGQHTQPLADVENKMKRRRTGAGIIDVTGSGLESISCLGEVIHQEWAESLSRLQRLRWRSSDQLPPALFGPRRDPRHNGPILRARGCSARPPVVQLCRCNDVHWKRRPSQCRSLRLHRVWNCVWLWICRWTHPSVKLAASTWRAVVWNPSLDWEGRSRRVSDALW